MSFSKFLFCTVFLFYTVISSQAQSTEKPFRVDTLFNLNKPENLGLTYAKGLETFTVFSPAEKENKYNHGVVLFPFKNMLYAQWQSSSVDEDGEDTQVFYSRSSDGKSWSEPMVLTKVWEKGIKTSGGWWSNGEILIAYISVWPKNRKNKEGYTVYKSSGDGINWSKEKLLNDIDGNKIRGVIEQDVKTLPSGRLLTAFHVQPGLIAKPFYTDDSLGVSGWVEGKMKNMPSSNEFMSRELEPSWFLRKDGAIVMIFRDQESSFKKLASVSVDNGETWTTPELIETPDSRAKQSAGNLPDGTAFMINNPTGNKNRYPLVVTLSSDGFLFDKAYLIRSGGNDLQPLRYKGKYKRIGYSYPKSIVWKDFLYVSYATNKEDVEITRIPLKSLIYE